MSRSSTRTLYFSHVSDDEWVCVASYPCCCPKTLVGRTLAPRAVVNALRYVA